MQMKNQQTKIDEEDVSIAKIGKFLGVKITNTFNWKTPCGEVASKLYTETAYHFSMLRAN